MNFSEIIKKNNLLGNILSSKEIVDIRILANISLNQLLPIIEYNLRVKGLNAKASVGDYDNILQESSLTTSNQIVIIFWELCNLIDSFYYEIENSDEDYYQLYLNKVKGELNLVFDNLSNSKLVLFNKFSHFAYTSNTIKVGNFEKFVNELNHFLSVNVPKNFVIIDIDKSLINNSLESSIDLRGFYTSKSLYTVSFFKKYSKFILPIILSIFGKSKKAIIFDCDNTLWKGVVGEDGPEGISLSDKDKNGSYFKEIHLLLKYFVKQGIIVGLCSKNNSKDVDEVFLSRQDFKLLESDVLIKKVNWNDKASNLKEMALELNIGIDSFVFIDDSEFEISLINDKLPEIYTITVPGNLFEYPKLINDNKDLFYSINTSEEDKSRLKMYKQNQERESNMSSFMDIEDYLGSLDIQLKIESKPLKSFERIVQLTQKTNQFNLTTKRYSSGEMQNIYNSNNWFVYSLEVSDKFGNSGVTGLCLVERNNDIASIDTFLMSCRIIGRNIETVFLYEILKNLKQFGINMLHSHYVKTPKNLQVESFYESNNFILVDIKEDTKSYLFDFNKQDINNNIKYITVSWNKN